MTDKEALLLEERIREIVREELAVWQKRQIQHARFGMPVNAEVKSPPRSRVDPKLIGED
jgi:hypothetical protein